MVSFAGLKLNKMGNLKEEVQQNSMLLKNCTFYVRINVNNQFIDTSTFKIVSSIAQIPGELKEKRNRRNQRLTENSPSATVQ